MQLTQTLKKNISYLGTFIGWKNYQEKTKYRLSFLFYFKLYWCLHTYFRFLFCFLGHLSINPSNSVKNLVFVGFFKNQFVFKSFFKNKRFLLKKANKLFLTRFFVKMPINNFLVYKNFSEQARFNSNNFIKNTLKTPSWLYYLQNKLFTNFCLLHKKTKKSKFKRRQFFIFRKKYYRFFLRNFYTKFNGINSKLSFSLFTKTISKKQKKMFLTENLRYVNKIFILCSNLLLKNAVVLNKNDSIFLRKFLEKKKTFFIQKYKNLLLNEKLPFIKNVFVEDIFNLLTEFEKTAGGIQLRNKKHVLYTAEKHLGVYYNELKKNFKVWLKNEKIRSRNHLNFAIQRQKNEKHFVNNLNFFEKTKQNNFHFKKNIKNNYTKLSFVHQKQTSLVTETYYQQKNKVVFATKRFKNLNPRVQVQKVFFHSKNLLRNYIFFHKFSTKTSFFKYNLLLELKPQFFDIYGVVLNYLGFFGLMLAKSNFCFFLFYKRLVKNLCFFLFSQGCGFKLSFLNRRFFKPFSFFNKLNTKRLYKKFLVNFVFGFNKKQTFSVKLNYFRTVMLLLQLKNKFSMFRLKKLKLVKLNFDCFYKLKKKTFKIFLKKKKFFFFKKLPKIFFFSLKSKMYKTFVNKKPIRLVVVKKNKTKNKTVYRFKNPFFWRYFGAHTLKKKFSPIFAWKSLRLFYRPTVFKINIQTYFRFLKFQYLTSIFYWKTKNLLPLGFVFHKIVALELKKNKLAFNFTKNFRGMDLNFFYVNKLFSPTKFGIKFKSKCLFPRLRFKKFTQLKKRKLYNKYKKYSSRWKTNKLFFEKKISLRTLNIKHLISDKKIIRLWKFKFWFCFFLENWLANKFQFISQIQLLNLNTVIDKNSFFKHKSLLSVIFRNKSNVFLMLLFLGAGLYNSMLPVVWYLEKQIKQTTKPPTVLFQTQRLIQTFFPFQNLFTFKLIIRGKLLKEKRMRSKKIIYNILKPKKKPKNFDATYNLFVAESKARIGVFSTQIVFVYWNLLLNE